MNELKLWAEVGTWDGRASMLIFFGREGGDGQDILHDVPLDFPDEVLDHADLPYADELEKLGYRVKPNLPGYYTTDGYLFEIDAL